MTKARLATILGVALFISGPVASGRAAAAVITSPLNCVISGTTCTGIPSVGTITFSDLGNVTGAGSPGTDVGISIALANSALEIVEVTLNTDLTDGTGLTVTGNAFELRFSQNGVSAGDCVLCFDIGIPPRGNLNATGGATFTLSLGSTNLTTANFFIANSAGLDAAINIFDPSVPNSGQWVGEPAVATTEPTSLVLLGFGLVGLCAWTRRRNRRT